MRIQHVALHIALKGLSREDLETYTMCVALSLFNTIDKVRGITVLNNTVTDEPLASKVDRVSRLVQYRVEKLLLESN